MREIVSPLSGIRSPFGQRRDLYKVLGFRPEFVAGFGKEYYRANSTRSTFANTLTHAATSNATMVDSDGLLKWRPHNLLKYSEALDNAAWINGDIVNATRSDGSVSVSADESYCYVRQLVVVTPDIQYTVVAEATCDTSVSNVPIRATIGAASAYSLENFTAGQTKTVSFNIIGNGTFMQIGIDNRDSIVPGGSDEFGYTVTFDKVTLYRSDLGGMVNNPDRGDSYVPTTSAAVYLPRRGHHVYDGSAWVDAGYLHESEARTNLVTYSQDFTNAAWTKVSAVTSLDAVGPDGVANSAVTLADNSGGGTGVVYILEYFTVTTATVYTYSVFAKADQLSGITLRTQGLAATSGNTYFNLSTGSVGTVFAAHTANIEDFGGGWYRCSITFTTSATAGHVWMYINETDGVNGLDLDGTSSILIYGAQLEAGPTPSSYIPTNGATATRAAETLTAPSANLPWPTPTVIGDELVTNGTFDTDSDWTKGTGWSISGGVAVAAGVTSDAQYFEQNIGLVSGRVYQYSIDVSGTLGGSNYLAFRFGGVSDNFNITVAGTYTGIVVASGSSNFRIRSEASTSDITIDNISVKEINPLAVSIQMEGTMTYADENVGGQADLFLWQEDFSNRILARLDTSAPEDGAIRFTQVDSGTDTFVYSGNNAIDPGVNVPFNIASRHGSTFINGAVDGTALTEDTTPVALPDLSSTDMQIGPYFNGTIKTLRVWANDIGDTGIEEASS